MRSAAKFPVRLAGFLGDLYCNRFTVPFMSGLVGPCLSHAGFMRYGVQAMQVDDARAIFRTQPDKFGAENGNNTDAK